MCGRLTLFARGGGVGKGRERKGRGGKGKEGGGGWKARAEQVVFEDVVGYQLVFFKFISILFIHFSPPAPPLF